MEALAKNRAAQRQRKPKEDEPPPAGIFGKLVGWGHDKTKEVRKSKPFDSYHEFAHYLVSKKGYSVLGSGFFSQVIGHPDSDKVIKVNRGADNWIDYALWAAKKGYAGGLAPKVYSFKQIKTSSGGVINLAVMERLDKTVSNLSYKSDARAAYTLLGLGLWGNVKALELGENFAPGIKSFITDFRSEFGMGGDWHGDNLMIRKDGSLVISDPIAAPSKLTVKRLKSQDFTPTVH